MAAVTTDLDADAGRPRRSRTSTGTPATCSSGWSSTTAWRGDRLRDRHRRARLRRGDEARAQRELREDDSAGPARTSRTTSRTRRTCAASATRCASSSRTPTATSSTRSYLDVAEADQRRAVPDAGRRPGLGEVAVDAGGALDRSDRRGLPRRPGDAGHVQRLAAERRAAEAEHRALGHRRQPGRQQLQVEHDLRAAARQGAGHRQARSTTTGCRRRSRRTSARSTSWRSASTPRCAPRRRPRSRST